MGLYNEVKNTVNKIRNAYLGIDVRDNIANGIDKLNDHAEVIRRDNIDTKEKQNILEVKFDNLVADAGNSNAENVAARTNKKGKTFITIGERMDETDSQINNIENDVNEVLSIINNKHPASFHVETLTMSNNLIKTLVNEKHNLIAIFNPISTTMNKTIIWLSSDTNVATVTQKGVVTTKKIGECTITAVHILSGLSCSCDIQVLEKLSNGDPVITPITINTWNVHGTDWVGQDDLTSDYLVTSAYIPIDNTIVELECPQGMLWSYIFFYEGTTPLTNRQDGEIAGKDATTPNKKVSFSVPINATHFRITICDITYRLSEAQRLASELKIKGVFLDNEGFVYYDKYKSNSVILNTRDVILNTSKMSCQLEAIETPLGSKNGLTFTSSNTNVATVTQKGLINSVRPGSCYITVKNKNGSSCRCDVTVERVADTGTMFSTLAGANNTEKLKNALETLQEVNGVDQSYSINSIGVAASTSPTTIIRNATFVGLEDKTRLTINGGNNVTTFENCTFENVGLYFANFAGTMKFINCVFKDWKYTPIHIAANGATLEFVNTIFKDAKPDKQEWIQNVSWIRFHGYNPIEAVANDITIKVNKCTFNNIMARCVIHWQSGYTGGVINFTDNTIYKTEGHCISMESACSGDISNNHFSFVGELRGAFGKDSLVGEDQHYPNCFGVGGNAIFSYPNNAPYSDITANYNNIRYAMENGIEGGLKEIAYNNIEYTGYRYKEGYNNHSMEGIWGSARNGIHHNVIINPQMDGIRVQNYGLAGVDPCLLEKNITIFNDNVQPKEIIKSAGASIVVLAETGNKNVIVEGNTIIGFKKITRLDGSGEINFNLQTESEYAY